jgi:2-polyprenyl-3-methyl-5-hydroxy-6-metoxy-1,4-benzoquinol methylase
MKFPFSKRQIQPELLEHASLEEARANLAQIVRLNEHFGGHGVVRKALAQAVNGNPAFTLLDMGAASGDTARLVKQIYPSARVTSVDLNLINLADAPEPKLLADAFHLPFKEASFDYVFCSLFLHHFEDTQVSDLMAGFYGVARRALVVSDLERHILPYLFFPATRPFFGWTPLTMHDGMCSIRAAFRASELRELAENAGIQNARVEIHRPAFRLSLVGLKEAGAVVAGDDAESRLKSAWH